MSKFNKNIKSKIEHTEKKVLSSLKFETTLGSMVAIADEQFLYLLEFSGSKFLERKILFLSKRLNASINKKNNEILKNIESEISCYFAKKNTNFKTPILMHGSTFQQNVWCELKKIPYGMTCSYMEISKSINKPNSFRAVAQANGANMLAIIVPCHRVINKNGTLGGYSSGVTRKKWLIAHEKN